MSKKFDYKRFKKYVTSYEDAYPNCDENFSANSKFLDMLYGIALSIDSEKYKDSKGFELFLNELSGLSEIRGRLRNAKIDELLGEG